MSRSSGVRRVLAPTGAAAVGVLVGHWLAYVIAVPGAGLREQLLAQTGHSYWELAVKLAAVLAVVGVGTILAEAFGRAGRSSEPERFSLVASRLIALQVVAFTAMESAERLAAGAPLSSLVTHAVLLVGLAVQVLTAFVGAMLLVWLRRSAERLVAAIRGRRATRPARLHSWSPRFESNPRPILVLAGAAGTRSPPRP